jgi:hypothetical protein
MLGLDPRNVRLACLLFTTCACGAPPPPAANPAARTSFAAATSAIASGGPADTEPPIELGSERDADLAPSITAVGEELSYTESSLGAVGAAQLTRTMTRLGAKLDAAKKYWALEHQSPFPTTLPIELGGQHRALLLKELLSVATAAEFANVELSVQSNGNRERVSLTLRSPEWQDMPRMTKRLHVTVAPGSRYLLAWREGSTVVSTPYRELFAAPPANLDLPAFLAQKVNEEWLANGQHRVAIDPLKDVAVLHLNDALALDALLVVTHALGTPARKWQGRDKVVDVPAFELYVATD